jgi:hypothetical protein
VAAGAVKLKLSLGFIFGCRLGLVGNFAAGAVAFGITQEARLDEHGLPVALRPHPSV